MIRSKNRKPKAYATPWDAPAFGPGQRTALPPLTPAGAPATSAFLLRGVYIFDPKTCTSEEVRRFLWAGLRVLDKEAKARGLSDDEVRRIVTGTFDVFHDSADAIWGALRRMKAEVVTGRTGSTTVGPKSPSPPSQAEPLGTALAGLRRAYLRQSSQVRAYREEQEKELDALVDD